MKKNLIALAILGAFSGAALAQSNVTLYGIVDVNFQYQDPEGPGSSTRGINSGHQSGSRFGFRGSEALSSNLNAVFTIEGGFNTDLGTSAQGGRLFGRQVWGGLSGGWGTLVAGRVATFSSGTGSFDMFGNTDPFLTGFGDSGLQNTFSAAGATRLDNSILYQTPSFGGFKFGAGYSFNASGAEGAGSGNNNRYLFLGANFARGPFFAAITYDSIDFNDSGLAGTATTPAILPNAQDQKMLQIGATFDLKFVKLHAGYAKEDDVYFTSGQATSSAVPDGGADANAWMVGVTVPLLGGSLLGSYQKRDGDIVNTCLGGFVPATGACAVALSPRERDIDVWAIGYTYPLSRRTNLYASYSDKDGKQSVNNIPSVDRKEYTIGMRHLF